MRTRLLLPLLTLAAGCAGAPHTATRAPGPPAEPAGWTDLLAQGLGGWSGMNGADTGEWLVAGAARLDPADDRRLVVSPGSGVLANGPRGKTRNLFSRGEFGDVEAHLEFMVPRGSNSGVFFQGRYEIQILDSYGVQAPKFSDCGGIYQRFVEEQNHGFDGHPPRTNASRPAGEWQTFDVVFRAPRFDAAGKKIANARFDLVKLNGVVVHERQELSGPTRNPAWPDERPTGPLRLQGDHGWIAFRNLRVRPLP